MASACVKSAGVSPEKFSAFGWTSPRMSLTREDNNNNNRRSSSVDPLPDKQDPVVDFEFCLEDPVTMLSADELFSDGKLVPLKFSGGSKTTTERREPPEILKSCRRLEMEISDLFSPKAPRCTTRWRELLGLKRLVNAKPQESTSAPANPKTSSLKQFLHRGSKSSSTAASSPPLQKESESISIASSRLSLSSSSSSGHEIDDLPRLSLDLDKPSPNPFAPSRTHLRNTNQPSLRFAKPRRHHPPSTPSVDGSPPSASTNIEPRGLTVTADSPRLNASGKIVFHGLERSSSSPGSFTGGPRMKQHHGMPRSYSANVRITPVLNVPVCSLKSGLFFGQLFSSSSSSSPSPGNKPQIHSNGKNRSNRTRLEPKFEQLEK
ncbi:hypothetical protein CARUB_v10009464mg [Capsella rubella]|uniref:Uncharacterized protein n=1 Tax=Capsella rubella TaxID=81985 RepID=R0I6T0_9BRAS|nr:uncharacterized serine-rich protein C1E8.05 [Capsella rubella]EOA37994.1 hypothetical protein CARUB_v10009464mg [Capsella rubella]